MRSDNLVAPLDFSGGDQAHARAAWASTSTEFKRHKLPELLKFLAENDHGTPFEHSLLSFLVRSELASHIHLLKHRAGVSINCESARYKELKNDSFYIPGDWPQEVVDSVTELTEQALRAYHLLVAELTPTLGRKRAKETARFILPYNHQLTYVATFNFRSFMHFQKLRNTEEAQEEIAQIADEMLTLVRKSKLFEHSLIAYGF